MHNHSKDKSSRSLSLGLFLQVYWPLLIHFVLTVGTALFVAFLVNRHHFNTAARMTTAIEPDGTISHHGFIAQQSDITTIVSALLTILRLVGGIWTGATVWRCMFLLLKTGITLSDFQSTISWRFPTWCLPPFNTSIYQHFNANSKFGTLLLVTLTIFFTFPSQFSSPILTGSINWIPSTRAVYGTKQVNHVSNIAPGTEAWSWYRVSPEVMAPFIVDLAGATAVDTWGRNLPRSSGQVMRRYLYTASNLTVGSWLNNVTVPFFSIDSFRWLNRTETPPDIYGLSKNLGRYNLFPLTTSERPWVTLLPPKDWEPSQDPTFPNPHVKEESRILAVLVDRLANGSDPRPCSGVKSTFYFGRLPSAISLNGTSHCYAFAEVRYRAGAAVCEDCRIFATGVVESGDVSTLTLKNDSMTSEALVLLPKVAQTIVSGNSSVPLPWESNITYYVTEVISRSYQSTWSALTEEFHADEASLSTNVHIIVGGTVEAQVTFWRVWLWLALNVMLTLSGLFGFLYGRSELGMVFEAETTALLLDPTSISRYDDHQLSMFEGHVSDVSGDVGFLRLKKGVPPSSLRRRSPEMCSMEERWFLESVERSPEMPGMEERWLLNVNSEVNKDDGYGGAK